MNASAQFHSILSDRREGDAGIQPREEPAFFPDLNLDQVLASMTAGREQYRLEPFFYAPLHDVADVEYRHDILHDLETPAIRESITRFAQQMKTMRGRIAHAETLSYRYQKQRWFLDGVEAFRDAVTSLRDELGGGDPQSRGLQAFAAYLAAYAASDAFQDLVVELHQLRGALDSVTYAVHIHGAHVKVSKYEGESDYSVEVDETFAKFQQGAVKDYRVAFRVSPHLDQVETRVLDRVARLYPDVFAELDAYCTRHLDFVDPTLATFDREIQFYLAYLDYIARARSIGLPFCYPAASVASKQIHADDTFDLALADALARNGSTVVCNSFHLHDPERIIVVGGPNQGGKTTFARMFGQLHYLAALGLPVPGAEAALFLPDQLFTHFEREEDPTTLRGKLEDELVRIHDILEHATGDSVIIMNESFASTALQDALFVGEEVLARIVALDALCVCVTFIDELASLGPTTISMLATVVPEDPASRTYKLVRRPADGLAYAAAIAQKYGLNYEALRRRIAR